jgi:hypothetical protein
MQTPKMTARSRAIRSMLAGSVRACSRAEGPLGQRRRAVEKRFVAIAVLAWRRRKKSSAVGEESSGAASGWRAAAEYERPCRHLCVSACRTAYIDRKSYI